MLQNNEVNIKKIFYADDDFDDLEIFAIAAKQIEQKEVNAIDILLYSDGLELLKALKSIKPKDAVVFLDINMPIKNGFEILKEIRKDADLKLLPVIMFSTTSDSRSVDTSYDLGANSYAVKPYSIVEISDLIKKVIAIKWNDLPNSRNNFLIN